MNRLQSVGEPKPFPTSLKPMLATLVEKPFSDPKWLCEPKLDGFRILAFIQKGEVTLRTRNGNDYTGHYPWVAPQRSVLLGGWKKWKKYTRQVGR